MTGTATEDPTLVYLHGKPTLQMLWIQKAVKVKEDGYLHKLSSSTIHLAHAAADQMCLGLLKKNPLFRCLSATAGI